MPALARPMHRVQLLADWSWDDKEYAVLAIALPRSPWRVAVLASARGSVDHIREAIFEGPMARAIRALDWRKTSPVVRSRTAEDLLRRWNH